MAAKMRDKTKKLIARALGRKSSPSREEEAYRRLHSKGFAPDGIIDVGAYQGEWTRLTQRVFGPTPSLMIEPQTAKRPWLERVCADLPHSRYTCALLAGKGEETVTFYEMETGSSFMPENSNAPRARKTLVTSTLDDVADEFPGTSLFLKLDVQGAELQVLSAGRRTLERAAAVQLEVALLPYNEGAPTIGEVLGYMASEGFVPLDISGETRIRGHLIQIDVLFCPENSFLRPKHIVF